MSRYNLLDEKWIAVIRKDDGRTEKVSLKEVFSHSDEYDDLAGEMKTQDFAVLRVLLAVIQTVFSRFDSDGEPYDFLEIDSQTFRQMEPADREDLDDEDPFFDTWLNLWKAGKFPEVVQDYLEAWRDHFYLFDDQFPFYQVTQDEMKYATKKRKEKFNGQPFYGKNLNRTISESEHKQALFSPVSAESRKNNLYYDQLIRWLIMLQGYIGISDKQYMHKEKLGKKKWSKGWIYDLGGFYLKGHNLFETLMLNSILSTDFDEQLDDEVIRTQVPAWERAPSENIALYFDEEVDNRATLFTNWSRAIWLDSNYQEGKPFQCYIARLPEVNHVDNFLEPMTCWGWNKSGDNKEHFTPKKQRVAEAAWRHFNVLLGVGQEEGERYRQPGVLSWYQKICESGSVDELNHLKVGICTVNMRDDGNATSWVPVDEIVDEIQMETAVLIDHNPEGWIYQINLLINETKRRIDQTLGTFLKRVKNIRGYEKSDYHLVNQGKEELYQEIDRSFRDWLYNLDEKDSKNDKALEWYSTLEKSIREKGQEIYQGASLRDLKGIQENDKIMNIATAYNWFERDVWKQFRAV